MKLSDSADGRKDSIDPTNIDWITFDDDDNGSYYDGRRKSDRLRKQQRVNYKE